MSELLANLAESQLSAGITAGDATLTVLDASAFPAAGTFRAAVTAPGVSFTELVAVTAVAGATFTVSRGAEGTTARAWPAGAFVTCVLTAAGLSAYVTQVAVGAASAPPNFVAANKSGVTVAAGQPVATHASGTGYVRASASAPATACVGLSVAAVVNGAAGAVQTSGPLQLADWTTATGAAALLARALYYLDIPAGMLSTLSPTVPGQISQPVGVAVAPDTLDIRIGPPILL